MNVCEDGHPFMFSDPEAEAMVWEMRFSALTDLEWRALEELFAECAGALRTFLFLDPGANLLSFSDGLAANVWRTDPYLDKTAAVNDPEGGDKSWRLANNGQKHQGMQQLVDVPADYWYCFSLYASASLPLKMRLKMAAGTLETTTVIEVDHAWRRYALTGNLNSNVQGVQFGLEIINPGSTANVYGLQVEAQPSPSGYKRTIGTGGVYPNAHFMDDSLTVVTDGPDQHNVDIRVVSVCGR